MNRRKFKGVICGKCVHCWYFPLSPVIVLLWIGFYPLCAQQVSEQLKEKQKQLDQLQQVIQHLDSKLQHLEEKEAQLSLQLNLYQKQAHYFSQYLTAQEEQIALTYYQLAELSEKSEQMRQQLEQLRKEFQRIVLLIAREQELAPEDFFFFPEKLSEESRMRRYSQLFIQFVNKKAERILRLQDSLDCVLVELERTAENLQQLYRDQQVKKERYDQLLAQTRNVLEAIRKDRSRIASQLEQRKKSMQILKSLIVRLEKEAQAAVRSGKRRQIPGTGGNMRIQWPVESREILRPYGKYRNPETGLWVDNVGVGIALPEGSPVYAAAGGIVSLVHWLPGYGTVVILDHGNGLRTVYANLSQVTVVEGQVVNQGDTIGRSGSSVDGEYLHFEVWRGTVSVDPQQFLQ